MDFKIWKMSSENEFGKMSSENALENALENELVPPTTILLLLKGRSYSPDELDHDDHEEAEEEVEASV